MSRILFVCFLAFASMLTGCRTDLPPVTRVGANTVGAMINGHIWLPQINGLRPNISAAFTESDSLLTVTATNLGDGTYFLWELHPLPDAGSFLVEEWSSKGIRFEYGEVADSQGGDRDPFPVVEGSGALEISLIDSENGVFAGEFSFDVVAPGGDTLEIREGRFDVRF